MTIHHNELSTAPTTLPRQKLFHSKDITKANNRSYRQKSFIFLHSERIIWFHYFRFFVLPLLLFIDFTYYLLLFLLLPIIFVGTTFRYASHPYRLINTMSIFSDEPDGDWHHRTPISALTQDRINNFISGFTASSLTTRWISWHKIPNTLFLWKALTNEKELYSMF